ncbi:SDR family oxidoreductase [Evansella clarkii]|uniref:SDR family oxidoreductase n=1 Tax=Evansella clarkii TaxID=79879 RepID=UPI00099633A9|nr:SDR family oxidoreductase [Evansella clarkii]
MNIFLTGSTGFLGGKLIRNLLADEDNKLFLLVRNIDKARKLAASLKKEEQQRIQLIKGDIAFPNCGISDNELGKLRKNVDAVYHLAALVKFDLNLRDDLFAANYNGTKHVADLAVNLEAKKLFYVSTAYTAGTNKVGTEELYPYDSETNNPYEESKIKSEHLAMSYNDRLDVSIFRPAIIVGDSATGEADSQFALYGFMRALDVFKRRVTRKQENNKPYRVISRKDATSNFVPVDYVCDILALAPERAEKNKIYNITNPNPPSNHQLVDMFREALAFPTLAAIEPEGSHLLRDDEKQMNEMVGVFKVYISNSISFKDDNTKRLIEGTSVEHLNLDEATVKMIIDAYMETKAS